ncbi:MAG TPA: CDP-alcohol phosphatidyltransferase family protein [Nitrospira sp.]|nr:CDP-alcohol phosphatidyltransferase family protein [Nitrospira sp.]
MNERTVEQGTELHGLSTAVLLPSVDLFGGPVRPALSPLTPIVGVGLFQRTVLTLQRAGIRQLIVLAGSEEDQLKQALARGPRVTIPVRWMPMREFPLDDPRTWESLAAEVRGYCLISGVGTVFSRQLIEQLRRDVQERHVIVVAQVSHEGVLQPEHTPVPVFRLGSAWNGIADLMVLPVSELSTAGQLAGEFGIVPIRRWLQHATVDGRVRVLTTGNDPSHWYHPVCTSADASRAEHQLFSSLKGEFEGLIDRYFNRKLSGWFTRFFVALGLSPNAITIMATVVGLLAAVIFGIGSYAAGIAAALLFQLAAVIDCSDGEVARLTFTESPFGAWLDITMDNVVHMAIFAGIAIGVYMNGVGSDRSWIPLALGAAAIFGNILSFALVSKAQTVKIASEWRTTVHAAWSDFMLKNVASRDFSVVLLLFALFGKLEWFLWMAAIGSIVFALVMLWVIRPSAIVTAKG